MNGAAATRWRRSESSGDKRYSWPARQADDTSDAISIIEITRDRRHRVRQTAAILSSLTSTCRRHGIDPQHYLTQLLVNLPATPISRLSDWLPDQWKLRNPSPSGQN
ncbi:MAG: transposase domain-containing protein [Tepidisphaeraceae bacterium]